MENATKALLIAGSVLIVILLIAIGLRIFNSTQGTTAATKVTMDSTAASMFNNQFTPYLGSNIKSSDVNILKQKIIASNASNQDHKVNESGVLKFKSEADADKFYTVTPQYDSYGYIKDISIVE